MSRWTRDGVGVGWEARGPPTASMLSSTKTIAPGWRLLGRATRTVMLDWITGQLGH